MGVSVAALAVWVWLPAAGAKERPSPALGPSKNADKITRLPLSDPAEKNGFIRLPGVDRYARPRESKN
jgi:hypothetical protein